MRRSRGVYRSVYSTLLDDPDWLRLSPNARLVLLTMRVSKECGLACIWCCYPATLALQTGLSESAVKRAMSELEQGKWIAIQYPIVWLLNGLRYDPTLSLTNPKHRTAVEKWLRTLPKLALVLRFCDYYKLSYPFDTLSDTHSVPYANPDSSSSNREALTTLRRADFARPHSAETSKFDNATQQENLGAPQQQSAATDSRNSLRATARDLLAFLNKKSGRHYQAVDSNLDLLVALLRKGTTPAQIRAVIGLRTAKWKGNPKMEEFLRPKTLFTATNFANYAGELPASAFEAMPDA